MKLKLSAAVLLCLLIGSSAFADPDRPVGGVTDPGVLALITDDDFFATADLTILLAPPPGSTRRTQHYGPYPSDSPDSGTCGNDWATDMFDRNFTVKTQADGTFLVVQQFKNGTFVTNSGESPGSCDFMDGSPPGTVEEGKTGKMHGYFIIPLPAGTTQTSFSQDCNAALSTGPCTTTTFINTHFSPTCYPVTCPVTTFFFHFSAGDQQLVEHEWKNASADRGGNHGDIRSMNVP